MKDISNWLWQWLSEDFGLLFLNGARKGVNEKKGSYGCDVSFVTATGRFMRMLP